MVSKRLGAAVCFCRLRNCGLPLKSSSGEKHSGTGLDQGAPPPRYLTNAGIVYFLYLLCRLGIKEIGKGCSWFDVDFGSGWTESYSARVLVHVGAWVGQPHSGEDLLLALCKIWIPSNTLNTSTFQFRKKQKTNFAILKNKNKTWKNAFWKTLNLTLDFDENGNSNLKFENNCKN